MNVKLLEKVKAAILAEPRQFQMTTWFADKYSGLDDLAKSVPNCGTAACIGGWAVTLGRRYRSPKNAEKGHYGMSVGNQAAAQIGLPFRSCMKLFVVSYWPSDLEDRYRIAATPKSRAKVAADRIDRFIATDGRE